MRQSGYVVKVVLIVVVVKVLVLVIIVIHVVVLFVVVMVVCGLNHRAYRASVKVVAVVAEVVASYRV